MLGGAGLIGVGAGAVGLAGGPEGAVILGGGAAELAWGIGSAVVLDQFDNDLQNLTDMQSWVNGAFATDGVTDVTMTITNKQITVGTATSNVLPTSITVQEITICTNLGVCSTTYTTAVPSDQHVMERFEDFIPEDEEKFETETAEVEDDF